MKVSWTLKDIGLIDLIAKHIYAEKMLWTRWPPICVRINHHKCVVVNLNL